MLKTKLLFNFFRTSKIVANEVVSESWLEIISRLNLSQKLHTYFHTASYKIRQAGAGHRTFHRYEIFQVYLRVWLKIHLRWVFVWDINLSGKIKLFSSATNEFLVLQIGIIVSETPMNRNLVAISQCPYFRGAQNAINATKTITDLIILLEAPALASFF